MKFAASLQQDVDKALLLLLTWCLHAAIHMPIELHADPECRSTGANPGCALSVGLLAALAQLLLDEPDPRVYMVVLRNTSWVGWLPNGRWKEYDA